MDVRNLNDVPVFITKDGSLSLTHIPAAQPPPLEPFCKQSQDIALAEEVVVLGTLVAGIGRKIVSRRRVERRGHPTQNSSPCCLRVGVVRVLIPVQRHAVLNVRDGASCYKCWPIL